MQGKADAELHLPPEGFEALFPAHLGAPRRHLLDVGGFQKAAGHAAHAVFTGNVGGQGGFQFFFVRHGVVLSFVPGAQNSQGACLLAVAGSHSASRVVCL